MVETKTVENAVLVVAPANISRYQYSNHLGSVGLELDETGQLISYEEFHPYGTTAYRAANSAVEVSASRYRYTGQERDEETGLGHHGARYYASWLGRWTAADPIGLGDGVNRYAYVSGNPIALLDAGGTEGTSAEDLNALRAKVDSTRAQSIRQAHKRCWRGKAMQARTSCSLSSMRSASFGQRERSWSATRSQVSPADVRSGWSNA